MSTGLQTAALLCTLFGLLSAAGVLGSCGNGLLSVKVLLEFLLAAGLLRLADHPTAKAIATAAAVVLLRKVVSFGLQHG